MKRKIIYFLLALAVVMPASAQNIIPLLRFCLPCFPSSETPAPSLCLHNTPSPQYPLYTYHPLTDNPRTLRIYLTAATAFPFPDSPDYSPALRAFGAFAECLPGRFDLLCQRLL